MKFENTEVWGFEHAIRGMRNPMNSWDKSDSRWRIVDDPAVLNLKDELEFVLGENDKALAQKLIKAGSEHRKFLRQIFVSVDITAPLFWWKEFSTYKVGTVANSTSTMHKLATTPVTMSCFETDDLCDSENIDFSNVYSFIHFLEDLRKKYLETKDKIYWKELVRWLPESYRQTRTVTMSYENVLNMIRQRANHKLNEWSGIDDPKLPNFISWAKTLPCAKELLFIEKQEEVS